MVRWLILALVLTGCTLSKQNVVLISVDTLGAKDIKNMEWLKNVRATRYINAYSQSPWSSPSHAAMLTGEYPDDLGIWTKEDILPDRALTIAEALKTKGYSTHAVSYGPFVHPEWGFGQGFDTFDSNRKIQSWDKIGEVYNKALEKISFTRKPFFVFIRQFHAHDEYTNETFKAIAQGQTEPEKHIFWVQDSDNELRRFVESLPAHTLVVITSDHGEDDAGAHGSLYQDVIHVPLIIISEENRIREEVMEVRSVPALIMEELGLPHAFDKSSVIARSITGISTQDILDAIQDGFPNLAPNFISTSSYDGKWSESIITKDYQVIRHFNEEFEIL